MRSMPQAPGKGLDNPKYIYKDDFTYNFAIPAALNAAGNTSDTVNMDGDSDFFLVKTTAFALVGGAATTYSAQQLPAVTVIITDTTSGRQLMNEAVPLANIAGTAQLPFIWPVVRYFKAKSTVKVDFFNVGNANYSALYFSFHGIKAFFGPDGQ